MYESYYINLDKRKERADLMQKNWSGIIDVKRFSAYDLTEKKQGTKGCYMSHVMAIALHNAMKNEFPIIMEDDIIPCKDFVSRLNLFIKELPKDWDIFMLGYSIHDSSKYEKVTEHIMRAKEWVGAGHCYMINHEKIKGLLGLAATESLHENNLDIFLNYLQKKHNVYMAVPSLCYQYSSFSDNSGMLLDNTKYTETFFKETL